MVIAFYLTMTRKGTEMHTQLDAHSWAVTTVQLDLLLNNKHVLGQK